jgi:hypothetical protein
MVLSIINLRNLKHYEKVDICLENSGSTQSSRTNTEATSREKDLYRYNGGAIAFKERPAKRT